MNDELRREDAYGPIRQGVVLQNLADACRSDEDRLRQVEEHPKDVLREHGIDVPAEVEVNVVLNTRDVFHLAMPPDPNLVLDDEALMAVAGGGKTVGTVATVASAGTIPSCVSSAGSVSSLASARDSI